MPRLRRKEKQNDQKTRIPISNPGRNAFRRHPRPQKLGVRQNDQGLGAGWRTDDFDAVYPNWDTYWEDMFADLPELPDEAKDKSV
jgi:hypothetical protein